MKKVIRLTESDLVNIVKRVINEQSEQSKKLYASWANKKSGNPERAMSIMDDVLKLQKSLPKKDFANYSSYDELKKDLDKVIGGQKEKDATKIYEDKDLLVIQANTWEASCKYGAGTKWCTAGKDTPSNWVRHKQTGTEFIWIFKNKPMDDRQYKYSYHVKFNGNNDWCDSLNMCLPTSQLRDNSYPKMHPKYDEIIQKLQSINDERPDPSKEKNEKKELIENWIDSHYEELEDSFLSSSDIKTMWEGIWDEQFNDPDFASIIGDDYDIDSDSLNDVIDEVRADGPPFEFEFEFSNYDLYYDVRDTIYKYFTDESHSIDGLRQLLERLSVDDIEFDSVLEQISEDMVGNAIDDSRSMIEDKLGI
jgi:hypothetical protein